MNGEFSYDPATRLVKGILLPFGELSRRSVSGTAPVMFGPGTVKLPRDPAVVTLNREHDQFAPIGRAVVLEERVSEGIYSEFAIANTDEGDAWLAENVNADGTVKPDGPLRKLSAEVSKLVVRAGKAISSALTGGAVVPEGAFASAALFALDEPVELAPDDELATCPDCGAQLTVTGPDITLTHNEDGSHTVNIPAPTTSDAAPAEDNPEERQALMGNIVPGGAQAEVTDRPTLNGLFAAIARGDRESTEPYADSHVLFALANIQDAGPAGATIGADTDRRGYLGELWQRAPYQRRFVPLVSQETLTDYRMTGWKWVTEPEMADYNGNAEEVPSNAVDTVPVDVEAKRLAGGNRLDRKFRDFNNSEVIGSYLVKQTESYKRKTDAKVVAGILAGSTVTAPGSVPAGVAKGLAAIVDGALGVIDTENRPAFALVAADLWRDIALMKADDKLAFLNAGFGLEEGDVDSFKILPVRVGAGVGQLPAGRVVVSAKEAFTFWELGETPIRVEGVVPGNGAEDVAAFGYWTSLVNNSAAIRSVQTV